MELIDCIKLRVNGTVANAPCMQAVRDCYELNNIMLETLRKLCFEMYVCEGIDACQSGPISNSTIFYNINKATCYIAYFNLSFCAADQCCTPSDFD